MGEPTVAMNNVGKEPSPTGNNVFYDLDGDGDGDSSTTPCHPVDPRDRKIFSYSSLNIIIKKPWSARSDVIHTRRERLSLAVHLFPPRI